LSVLIEEVVEIISPLTIDKDNSIKFSDRQTEIFIGIEEDQTYATVSVMDHGVGIPEENLSSIFQKFSTVPSAGINKPEGTGLGLAICKAITEAHDGKIWAESVKGQSSTFYFSLLKKRPQPSEPNPHSDLV
jgi:signal transduction histidine kinase